MSIPRVELTWKCVTAKQCTSKIEWAYVRVGFLDGNDIFGGSLKLKFLIHTLLWWALSSLFTMLPLYCQPWVHLHWCISWMPVSALTQVALKILFLMPSILPTDAQCIGVHIDVVVQAATGDKYDISRSYDSGVTLSSHLEEPTLTAMLKFEVPADNETRLLDFFRLVKQEKEKWYWLRGNNCHHMAFKVCKKLGAPDTESFDVFLCKNREYFGWKLANPLPPQY